MNQKKGLFHYCRVDRRADIGVNVRIYGPEILRIWQLRRITPHCFKNEQLVKMSAGSKRCFFPLHAATLKYVT
jgi:hypothetical protein